MPSYMLIKKPFKKTLFFLSSCTQYATVAVPLLWLARKAHLFIFQGGNETEEGRRGRLDEQRDNTSYCFWAGEEEEGG